MVIVATMAGQSDGYMKAHNASLMSLLKFMNQEVNPGHDRQDI